MKNESVVFSVDGERYFRTFDRTQLTLGRAVHVAREAGELVFRLEATPQTLAYYIDWIAPSQWQVVLRSVLVALPEHVDTLVRLVDGRLTRDIIERAAAKMLASVDPKRQYITAEFEKTLWARLLRVANRLDLCDSLATVSVGRATMNHWASVVEYHLLTCFDLMGQSDDWVTFQRWLRSKNPKHAMQRKEALQAEPTDPLACSLDLIDAHTRHFGVKQSFLRFLRTVLPEDARAALLGSFRITRSSNPPTISELPDAKNEEKEDYLYELRNQYTHNANAPMGMHPELFSISMPASWKMREQWVEKKRWVTVFTFGWPRVLRDAVTAGIVSCLRESAGGVDDMPSQSFHQRE